MSSKKRKQNEKDFPNWSEQNGGRLYWKDVNAGDKSGDIARYEKLVDSNENTISFIQKVFNKLGNLLEIHEKFPVDKGHIILMFILFIFVGMLLYKFV